MKPLCSIVSDEVFIVLRHALLQLQGNILDKYVGTGMFGGGAAGRNVDILFIDKKEVAQLLKIVRSQR